MQFTLPPDEMEHPHRPPAELRDRLTGPAPGLETQHPKIVSLTESLRRDAVGPGRLGDGQGLLAVDPRQRRNFRTAIFAAPCSPSKTTAATARR